MNRMQQIHVGLLTSMMVTACLATENKPFYEVLHKPEYILDVEDYHADIVLGMLPFIKTSIKDFRKRNFTNSDIENMYQTLTIFWPVVRKYLHLKEEFVDNEPSEDKEKYKQNTSSSSLSENNKIIIRDNVEFDNVKTRSKIGLSQISQSAPLVYKRKRAQPISSKIELNSTSTYENREAIFILNPNTSVSTPSITKQNINRRKYVPRFKSIRESLPMSDDNQTEIANPGTSKLPSSKDKQKTDRGNFVKIKGIRESSPLNNDKISIQRNFQSTRTTSTKNNSVNGRPFKSISNKYFPTTTGRPSRRPFKLINSDPISTAEETPHKSTSNSPFSYATRRPYSRTFTLINQDSISPAIERLIQSTGTTATKNNSANERPYKSISNESFSINTRRPPINPSKLASQDTKSTTEKMATPTAISTPAPSSTTTRRPSRRPSKPLSLDPISAQEESPFTSFYHKLLRSSALRLLQTAAQTAATENISKSTRTADRSKSTNTAGRSIPTTKFTPFPDSTINRSVNKSTRTAIRSKPTTISTTTSTPVLSSTINRSVNKSTRTAIRSKPTTISTTTSTPVLSSTNSRTASKIITSSSPLAKENVNSRDSATDGNGATSTSPVETLKPPVNENTFYYTDISRIMQALGNPIDLTKLTG